MRSSANTPRARNRFGTHIRPRYTIGGREGRKRKGGANVSDESRYGVVLTYSAAWLRQEENQYLDVPPEIAANLSPDLQLMLGYKMNGALGFHDPKVGAESRSPAGNLTEARSVS